MPERRQLEAMLDDLAAGGANGAVATRDGILVIDRLPAGSFPESVCAMAAATFAAAETACSEAKLPPIHEVRLVMDGRAAVVSPIGDELLLFAFGDAAATPDELEHRVAAAIAAPR